MGCFLWALIAFCLLIVMMSAPLQASTTDDAHMHTRKPIAAPDGFAGICDRYRWACARGGVAAGLVGDEVKLARTVNRAVNRATRAISDQRQYGTEEVWALPTRRGGDCEDFALLKKRELIRQGIAPERLLIATVLDRRRSAHAVLVLRTDDEDLILDNVRNQLLPWKKTGYSFMRMQNPSAPNEWNAVMLGGVFQ